MTDLISREAALAVVEPYAMDPNVGKVLELIEQLPAVVTREELQCLADVASVVLQDLDSGLADGTYEDDEIAGWSSDEIEKALNHVK